MTDAIRAASTAANNLGKFTSLVAMESENLAGMNAEDYTRQIGIQLPGRPGNSEIVVEIRPTRDPQLDKMIVTGVQMPLGREETTYKAAKDMEMVLGERIDRRGAAATLDQTDESIANATGLGARLAAFFASAMKLSNNPSEMHDRSHFLNEAQALVDRFHLFSDNYQRFEQSIQDRIELDTQKVNVALEKVADANREIKRSEGGGHAINNSARDRRESALRELGELISFDITQGEEGFHHIILTMKDSTGASIDVLDRSQVIKNIEYDPGTQAFKTTGATNPLALTGGSLRGHQRAVAEMFPDLKGRMGALANQVYTSVNTTYGTWTNPNGGTSSFFSGAGTAADIQVDPYLTPINLRTTQSGYVGENEIIKAIGDLSTRSFKTADGDLIDGTIKSYLSGLVSFVGNGVVSAKNKLNAIKDTQKMLLEQDTAKRGVSMPESIANIQREVQAFEYTKFVLHTLYKMDITDSFRK